MTFQSSQSINWFRANVRRWTRQKDLKQSKWPAVTRVAPVAPFLKGGATGDEFLRNVHKAIILFRFWIRQLDQSYYNKQSSLYIIWIDDRAFFIFISFFYSFDRAAFNQPWQRKQTAVRNKCRTCWLLFWRSVRPNSYATGHLQFYRLSTNPTSNG
jgi:hypothetical protein